MSSREDADAFCVHLNHVDATLPERATSGAAGYDLFAVADCVIPKDRHTLVSIGIQIDIPPNTYGRIAPRSSMSLKGIDVGAGVIDSDYTGDIRVLLINRSTTDYCIKKGDRIAQLILECVATPDIVDVTYNRTDRPRRTTDRNEGGFGSTGV